MTGAVASSYIPLSFAYAANGSGRLSLPVSASQLLYSNFEHVAGVAAPAGSAAVSIDRLKILDTLIDRLSSVKSEPLAAMEAPKSLTSERIDALIEQYGSELHRIAAAPPPALPYAAAPAIPAGSLFSIAA